MVRMRGRCKDVPVHRSQPESFAAGDPSTVHIPASIDKRNTRAAGLHAGLEDVGDIEALGAAWRDLEARSDGSFFTSWHWLGCWLRCLPKSIGPKLLTVRDGSQTVGLAILTRRRRVRHGVFVSHGLYLHETGLPEQDALTMEYNGILADRRYGEAVVQSALDGLLRLDVGWDELMLSGLVSDAAEADPAMARKLGLRVWVRDRKRFDFVDLEALRRGGGDYLAALSGNTRHQIRRSLRLYGGAEAVRLEVATNVDEALRFFAELKDLHQAYWMGRGQPGAFANPFFETFHRQLVADAFPAGAIQMLRVSAPNWPLGYLYNLVFGGRVYAYQSGFRYDADAKLKPGLVSHYLAIEHNLADGQAVYDFMAGEGQHKKSLGTDAADMIWLVLQRDKMKYRIERGLRSMKRTVTRW